MTTTPLPDVTCVIPTRDRPQLVREAIAAVVEQDYPGRIEVIVVFDRTEPDTSLERADDGRVVRVVPNSRKPGLAGGRNTGITASTSELVAFCDDDDTWLPGKLLAQVALLRRRPECVAATTGIVVDFKGTLTERPSRKDTFTFADLLRDRIMEAHPCTYLLRRSALDEVGLVDENIPGAYSEDYELLLRLARKGPIGAVIEPLAKINWHGASYFDARWDMIVDAQTYLLERYPEFASDRRGHARVLGQIAFAHAAAGRKREALATARRTLARNPAERRALLAAAIGAGVVSPDRILHYLHERGRGI